MVQNGKKSMPRTSEKNGVKSDGPERSEVHASDLGKKPGMKSDGLEKIIRNSCLFKDIHCIVHFRILY